MSNIYLEQLTKMAAEESEAYQKMKANRAKAGKDMDIARNQRISEAPTLKEGLTPAQKRIQALQAERKAKAAKEATIAKMKAESDARRSTPSKPAPVTSPPVAAEPQAVKPGPGANSKARMEALVEQRKAVSNKTRLDNALKNSGAGELRATMADSSHNPHVKINNHAGFDQVPPMANTAPAATPKTNFNANNVHINGAQGFGLPQQGQGGHVPGGTTAAATEASKAVPKVGPQAERHTTDHLSALRKWIPKSTMGKVGLGLAGLGAVGAGVAVTGHNKAAALKNLGL